MKRIQSGEFVGGYLGDTLGEYDRCDRSKLWILFTNIETVNRLPATGYRELPLISPPPPPTISPRRSVIGSSTYNKKIHPIKIPPGYKPLPPLNSINCDVLKLKNK